MFAAQATHGEAAKAVVLIFSWDLGKYKKVSALVTSVIRTGVRDKIILVIKKEKTWKIAFSLCGVTWPRGKEPYADEAFELLRQTILHTKVEVSTYLVALISPGFLLASTNSISCTGSIGYC